MTKPIFEILGYEPTPLGVLCLRRRELLSRPGTIVTEITLNHEFLMSSYLTRSEQALASCALAMHRGSDLRVPPLGPERAHAAHISQNVNCDKLAILV
jgi:hypothetical protein